LPEKEMDAAFFVASHTTPPGSASRLRHLIRPLSYIECAAMAIKHFKVGDHVSWNSEAGRVSGKIIKVITSEIEFKGYKVHASKDEPQYEIKSDKTDHIAMHKGSALTKLSG
jgi:hypothetical protein